MLAAGSEDKQGFLANAEIFSSSAAGFNLGAPNVRAEPSFAPSR
jgi:hypothetical protein